MCVAAGLVGLSLGCLSVETKLQSVPDHDLAHALGDVAESIVSWCCAEPANAIRLELPADWTLHGEAPPSVAEQLPVTYLKAGETSPAIRIQPYQSNPLPPRCPISPQRGLSCDPTDPDVLFRYRIIDESGASYALSWSFGDALNREKGTAVPDCRLGEVLDRHSLPPGVFFSRGMMTLIEESPGALVRDLRCSRGLEGVVTLSPRDPLPTAAEAHLIEHDERPAVADIPLQSPLAWSFAAAFPLVWLPSAVVMDYAQPVFPGWMNRTGMPWFFYSFALLDLPAIGFAVASIVYGVSALERPENQLAFAGSLIGYAMTRVLAMITVIRMANAHNAGVRIELGLDPYELGSGFGIVGSWSLRF